jgi:glycosyltransferase involved in cell wall biosynthesis
MIVLHLHAEWFTQSNFDVLKRRLRHVDRVFAVSDHIRRKTQNDFPEIRNRIETIYCGIDPQEFTSEKDYAASRKKNEKSILYCGAVSPHKGPHVLLDAFRMVVTQDPRVRLEFVGSKTSYPMEENFDMRDTETLSRMAPFYAKHRIQRIRAKFGIAASDAGTYQAWLREKIKPDIADKVTFRGFIPREEQIKRYYDSDVFAFPPVWDEGCGIPPIEAMAASLPVVGSRSGGLLETVKEGETGFLVAKNDASALARCILQLVRDDDLRERMGRAARKHALVRFTWKRIASQVEAQYRMKAFSEISHQRTLTA